MELSFLSSNFRSSGIIQQQSNARINRAGDIESTTQVLRMKAALFPLRLNELLGFAVGKPRKSCIHIFRITGTDINDEKGGVISRHDYLPFGEELYAGRNNRPDYAGDNVTQKFTGKERDGETELDYFAARYYNNHQGRFTSPDPLFSSGRATNPQSWNRYVYTLDNPLKYTDPYGLYEFAGGTETQQLAFMGALADIEYARDRTKKGTKEWKRLNDVLKAYGGYGVKNGVTIKFGDPGRKGAGAKTSPTLPKVEMGKLTSGSLTVTFRPDQLNDSDYFATLTAHEGQHVADFQEAFSHAFIGKDGRVTTLPGLHRTEYELEDRGIETQQLTASGLGITLTVADGPTNYQLYDPMDDELIYTITGREADRQAFLSKLGYYRANFYD